MSLLQPGVYRADGIAGDAALLAAMLRVEAAWARVLGNEAPLPTSIALDPREVEDAGNPVLPLVKALRATVDGPVHDGLTSQDVLDTALMLLARDAVRRVLADLDRAADALAALADTHRRSIMAARTLTQHAVPITFGLKAAHWLLGILDAADALSALTFAAQCGGAAGTVARAGELVADPLSAAHSFAHDLGLDWPSLPWHTRRAPVTRIADALVQTVDTLGVVAGDVLLLGRPEIGEVREGAAIGRGGSSTMPHKRNPVLAVLVRAASLRAPQFAAQLHGAAAAFVDERPDGAWHAEWPAVHALLELAVVASAQAAELVEHLEVDPATMADRVAQAADDLLAESASAHDPAGYLGAADAFVSAALARAKERGRGR